MLGRKRLHCDADSAGDVLVLEHSPYGHTYTTCNNAASRLGLDGLPQAHQQQQQQTCKRSCGAGGRPAPGELSSVEVATYLHSLSSHLNTCQLQHAGQVLSTEGWQAFAELNMLLTRFLSTDALPDGLLRGYHSFTRQPRHQLWQVYSSFAKDRAIRRQEQQQRQQDQQQWQQQQLALVLFLLEWVLVPYPDCSLTEVTLQLPPWMVSWASRWGMSGTANSISLVLLEAYAPLDPGSSSSVAARRKPVRKLFVPVVL